ncbi:hypothetical protein BDF22DRAFT_675907 [Syncephalis plumigaleata]|nr:hypothetical protein BDF22DRAFT_675907 [Syncephalis plumigaleata]
MALECNYSTTTVIDTVVYQQGRPLVIRMQDWCMRWRELFSLSWLQQHSRYGKQQIELYHVDKREAITDWTLGQFTAYLQDDASSLSAPIYAKDMRCPIEWKQILAACLPDYLIHLGSHDLMQHLPDIYKAENLMCYLGRAGTFTPGHVDPCGSIGHNIMMNGGPEATAVWYIIARENKQKATQFWQLHSNQEHSLDLDNYFMPIDILKKAPFPVYKIEQRVGDLIIVSSYLVYEGDWSVKVAWSRITVDSLDYCIHNVLPVYRSIMKPEIYRAKTIVEYALRASTNHLQGVYHVNQCKTSTEIIRELLGKHAVLMRLLRKQMAEEWLELDDDTGNGKDIELDISRPQDHERLRKCDFCEADIWNRWYHCSHCTTNELTDNATQGETAAAVNKSDGYDLCIACFSMGRGCRDPRHLQVWDYKQACHFIQLYQQAISVYNKVIELYAIPSLNKWPSFNITRDLHSEQLSAMTVAHKIYNHLRDRRFAGHCQYCQKVSDYTLVCKKHGTICARCLWHRYQWHFFMWLYERNLTCPECQPNDKPALQRGEIACTQPLLRYNLPEEDPVHTLSIVDQEQWQLSNHDDIQNGNEEEKEKAAISASTSASLLSTPPYQVWDTTSLSIALSLFTEEQGKSFCAFLLRYRFINTLGMLLDRIELRECNYKQLFLWYTYLLQMPSVMARSFADVLASEACTLYGKSHGTSHSLDASSGDIIKSPKIPMSEEQEQELALFLIVHHFRKCIVAYPGIEHAPAITYKDIFHWHGILAHTTQGYITQLRMVFEKEAKLIMSQCHTAMVS